MKSYTHQFPKCSILVRLPLRASLISVQLSLLFWFGHKHLQRIEPRNCLTLFWPLGFECVDCLTGLSTNKSWTNVFNQVRYHSECYRGQNKVPGLKPVKFVR